MQLNNTVISTKKPYHQPTLVTHGHIRELTKATNQGTAFDAFPILPTPNNRSII
ncbi:MAG: hypothetical protein NZ772_06295 [Cyanobacteria bacterium]|nr:hypothetical protein [Cyanobacteriota bacterium]MDW8201124.1 hypothetical protein [Cyanobacteriota bacterium SKYGB_h_bin112]